MKYFQSWKGFKHSLGKLSESSLYSSILLYRSIGVSQSAEVAPRERSRGREPEKERPSPVPAVPELPKEEIDKKTKAILDEYLHTLDMKVRHSIYIYKTWN